VLIGAILTQVRLLETRYSVANDNNPSPRFTVADCARRPRPTEDVQDDTVSLSHPRPPPAPPLLSRLGDPPRALFTQLAPAPVQIQSQCGRVENIVSCWAGGDPVADAKSAHNDSHSLVSAGGGGGGGGGGE